MNENENLKPDVEEDEISLLDLFAVLIKHRVMIIAGTALVFVFTCLKLFILPLFGDNLTRGVSIEYRIAVNQLPLAIEQEISSEKNLGIIKTMAETQYTDLMSLVEEIKVFNPFDPKNEMKLKGYEYNSYVQNLIKNKTFEAKSAAVRSEIIVKMNVPETDIDNATRFVQNLTAKNNKELEDYFFPLLDSLDKSRRNAYETLVASANAAGKSDIQSVLLILNQLDEFRAGYNGFLSCNAEPFIIPQPLGRAKRTLIITFATFFVLVFVAFLLNAIENIKKDPEASELIKTAWDGGKIFKKK